MKKLTTYFLRLLFICIEWILLLVVILFMLLIPASQIEAPEVSEMSVGKRKIIGDNHYTLGTSSLQKTEDGIWVMYLEGEAYERGLIYGELAQELVQEQEDIFVAQIKRFVPSTIFQQFLRLFIGFFNADLPKHVNQEYQQEIYGVSRHFSESYDYIAPKYTRILNYHAAHDIGHALNDYSLVGCTSFALKGKKSKDGKILVGRNFDFYVGDDFAREKLLLFMNPEHGHSFVSYSWAGFMGVASGMNDQGLTVSINASKSDLPTASKTPISILAREILQYASTIDEAVSIAKKRETFVSESILVVSAKDQKMIIIEKTPKQTKIVTQNTDLLVCANHYQSDFFMKDKINLQNIAKSDSKFRFDRISELLNKTDSLTPIIAASILRNQKGMNDDTLGMGNPKALNQLLAHHSFIALPEEGLFYVSTAPWQLGKFVGYDLKASFRQKKGIKSEEIPEDPFLSTPAYTQFIHFRKVKQQISDYLMFNDALSLSEDEIKGFIASNSESYVTYELLGKYFQKKEKLSRAAAYFSLALSKEVASIQVKQELQQLKKACTKKIK